MTPISAQVKHLGQKICRGTFDTPLEAVRVARDVRLGTFTHRDPDRWED